MNTRHNRSTDEDALRLRRVKQTTALFMAQYRAPQTLTLTPDGVDRIAVLPSLDPWTVGTLFLEP